MAALGAVLLAACGGGGDGRGAGEAGPAPLAVDPQIATIHSAYVATFDSPWALAALPDGRLLVTENLIPGQLTVVTAAGVKSAPLAGAPTNRGLFDVVLHPDFAVNKTVFVSFLELGGPDEPRTGRQAANLALTPMGLAVFSATLVSDGAGPPRLENARVIWRLAPKMVCAGQFGGRIAFSPDKQFLFMTVGDHQELEPVQSLANTLGKTIRLNLDGSVPITNPFARTLGARPEIWTFGHRNHYGLAFAPDGRLWSSEMGPMGGDEINLLQPGGNYGWPWASNGTHYDGGDIPDHSPSDGYIGPALSWTPVIAPAGMIFYSGDMFKAWRGDAILTGLRSNGLVRVRFQGTNATEVQRLSLGARTRDVTQGIDGSLWVLEDSPTGRLLRLTPGP